ncbi:MAG: carotenoid biosynthesis protein [Haliscomenobacter sp.]|nr:carotenoid biosynthesis protein [Haliscomenobacter sp.]
MASLFRNSSMLGFLPAPVQQPEGMAIAVLSILYAVGVVGVLLPIHPDFIFLTPLNLLISVSVMLGFHQRWTSRFVAYLGICFVVGFGAEVYGVQTGRLFGAYTYGEVLGIKVFETPLLIGVNWVLVTYSAAAAVGAVFPKLPRLAGSALAAVSMVLLDVLIEPDAIQYGFWTWDNGNVPMQNYLGWFLIALPLQLLLGAWIGRVKSNVAAALFILQGLFFALI